MDADSGRNEAEPPASRTRGEAVQRCDKRAQASSFIVWSHGLFEPDDGFTYEPNCPRAQLTSRTDALDH